MKFDIRREANESVHRVLIVQVETLFFAGQGVSAGPSQMTGASSVRENRSLFESTSTASC